MSTYEIIEGPEADEIVDNWSNRQSSETNLGIKDRLIRLGMVLVGDTPSSFSLIRQQDANRARARALSMAPVREVQKHVSADGTVRHHIVREKRQRK